MQYRLIGISALLLAAQLASADVTITIPDGRQVLLRDNGTWSVVKESADSEKRRYAVLKVIHRNSLEPSGLKDARGQVVDVLLGSRPGSLRSPGASVDKGPLAVLEQVHHQQPLADGL